VAFIGAAALAVAASDTYAPSDAVPFNMRTWGGNFGLRRARYHTVGGAIPHSVVFRVLYHKVGASAKI